MSVSETPWTCFDLEFEQGVAHLRLSRPDEKNSLNRAFWRELPEAIAQIHDRALARCIVISSSGKHFCAGMDLSVFSDGVEAVTRKGGPANPFVAAESQRLHVKALQDVFSCIDNARMPVLAAIQGGCIGGGVDLSAACDIRYATRAAFVCIQEVNLGFVADVGTFPRLCKLIPQGQMRELAYTGRRFDADRAKAIGFVNAVYDTHDEMLQDVLAIAREIAAKAPLAITGSKVHINYARDHSVADCLDYVALWQAGMFSIADVGEAMTARRDGRAPVYSDLLPIRKGV